MGTNRSDGPDVFGGLRPLEGPLAPIPADALRIEVSAHADVALPVLRGVVGRLARAAGLSEERAEAASLAVHELTTNSLAHADDACLLHVWHTAHGIAASITDSGSLSEEMLGEPQFLAERGRGLWLASRLCDLAEVQTGPGGTEIRIAVHRERAAEMTAG